MKRFILHCDLDAFFASVEVRDNPNYQNSPVIIGADPKDGKGRGVVSTCNYEARKFGIRSAMPISIAYQRCPQGIYLRPNFNKYNQASNEVMEIIKSFSSKFQQVSIDEAYIDISETCDTFDEVQELMLNLQQKIHDSVGITISIGCASSKSIAKIASDFKKPNGITIVRSEEIKEFLSPMDITRIPGIGKKSKKYYNNQGIRVIGDLINIPLHKMVQKFGKSGNLIWEIVNGLDKREVKNSKEYRKSISKERTFYKDTNDFQEIISKFDEIIEKLHNKVKQDNIYFKTITLKIRFEGFITYTRSKTLPYPTQDKEKAINIILELYQEFSKDKRKIRLVGIKISNLSSRSKVIQKDLLSYVND
jgi:DNA polymerase IV (DinB-like DNA polymerase)